MSNQKEPVYKFKTGGYGVGLIERVEITRETENSVWLPFHSGYRQGQERRESKRSSFHQYHDTWQDAAQHLVAAAEAEVERYRQGLKDAESDLEALKAMAGK